MNRMNFTRDVPRIAIDFNGFASILQGRGQGKARNVISCGHLGSKMVCIVSPFRKIRAWDRVFFRFWNCFFDSSVFRRECIPPDSNVYGQIRMYTARFECIRAAEYARFVASAEYALSGHICWPLGPLDVKIGLLKDHT